jgi:predicted metal-dependent hydrolase
MDYVVRINKRAKRVLITVHPDARVSITTPRKMRLETIERLMLSKRRWILESQEKMRAKYPAGLVARTKHSATEIKKYKEQALCLVNARLGYFNTLYNYSYKKVMIRNQKSRWGSCSRQGTLSFNYRLALIPAHLADYVIVHELCHLKQMNHSPKFWTLVEKTIPDYKARRKELRTLQLG